MTQEDIMKRRMHLAIIFAIVSIIGMLVFVALYLDETKRVQNKYREQFVAALNHTSESLDSYLKADADYDFRYRNIISNMSSADSFCFLLDNLSREQKVKVNELCTALIKYPEQMRKKERLSACKVAVDDLAQNLDKGFEEAEKITAGLDKLGK